MSDKKLQSFFLWKADLKINPLNIFKTMTNTVKSQIVWKIKKTLKKTICNIFLIQINRKK